MVFLGQLDANVVALDSKTGKEVWKTAIEDWHDGYGITSAPLYYDGIVYSGITGGEFGVRGRLTALDAKTGIAGPAGPLVEGVDTIKIGANNMEYVFFPGRAHLKAGTTVTFTNAGDTPHSATSFESGKVGTWDTGILTSGESKTITFDKPGNYFYICTPHPSMYGQVVVE